MNFVLEYYLNIQYGILFGSSELCVEGRCPSEAISYCSGCYVHTVFKECNVFS